MNQQKPGRREFLKATAATASTLALSGAASVHAAGCDVLKVGLVGCGGRGTGAAQEALRADPQNQLWAMGDAFRDRLTSSLSQLRGRNAIARADQCAGRTPVRRVQLLSECD